jgi:hypothetical protein
MIYLSVEDDENRDDDNDSDAHEDEYPAFAENHEKRINQEQHVTDYHPQST